jgi:outer membrane protein assembly factor BamD
MPLINFIGNNGIRMKQFLVIGLVAFSLSACSTDTFSKIPFMGDDEEEQKLEEIEVETPTAAILYETGRALMDENRYSKSIESFQEIERVYPFDKLATKAQVMIAYAYYKDEEFDDAVAVIDKFARLSPGHKDVSYMYYLKGLCFYDRIADIKRDQKVTKLALKAMRELVTRYPDTSYARDAKLKIDLVQDHLAGKHMEIGRFYLNERKYIAAINRFKIVVDDYQSTNHIEEALYRLTEAYLSMGLKDEAKKNASVLGHNYSESKWYRYAYALVEGGVNSAKPEGDNWWKPELNFNFGGAESAKQEPLPKDNIADSWLDKLVDSF